MDAARMDLAEFLDTFVTAGELKDVLLALGQPRGGTKDVRVSCVTEATRASSVEAIVLLRNETLQNALHWSELSPVDEIVLHCRTGARSAQALGLLKELGFTKRSRTCKAASTSGSRGSTKPADVLRPGLSHR